MPRIPIIYRAVDEAGNATGGSPQQVRIWDDFACTVASVVTDDSGGGTTITQPLIPNAGTYTTLAVTTAAVDTTITVVSTTGFAVGQLIPIYDPTNTVYKFIRAILSGPPRLTLESAVGFIFSTANTQVGNLDQVGVVGGWVLDTSYHYSQVTDVASGRKGPPQLISAVIGSANVGVLDEGAGGGTRPTVNFIGDPVTAVDNPGASRVDVTVNGRFATGSEALPGVAATSDTDTGLWWETGNVVSVVGVAKRIMQFLGQTSAVNYLKGLSSVTGSAPILYVGGTDTNVGLRISSQGTGAVEIWTATATHLVGTFVDAASAVNYLQFVSSATGVAPQMGAAGSDTNIGLLLMSKGTGSVNIQAGSGARNLAVFVDATSAVNYLQFVASAAAAAVQLQSQGTDSNIDMNLVPKGTGTMKYKGNPMWPLNSSAAIGAVTMTSANVWYDGPSLSLTVGTWLVWATLTIQSGNVANGFSTMRLSDGTNHYVSTESKSPAVANDPVSLTCVARITLGGTTTIKAQAANTQPAGAILGDAPHNTVGTNTASNMVAFQVLTS